MNVVFPPSPLPYGDTETRTLLSTSAGTGGISWNTSTLKYDISVPASYTDTNVRTVLSTSAGTNMVWNTTTNKFDVTVSGGGSSKWTTTGNEIYYSAGRVGIGLTNPSSTGATLQVTGTASFSQPISLSSTINTSYWWDGNGNTFLGRGATAGNYSSLAGVGDLVLSSNQKLILKTGVTANGSALCVDTLNNVGIGITNPGYKFDVSGTINATGYRLNGVVFTSTQWITSGSDIYYNTGNVGIGLTNPSSRLHILTPDPATNFSLLDFRSASNYGIYAQSNSIGSRGNTLSFLARDFNNSAGIQIRDVLTLRPEGNVGIGTTNPTTAKLVIAGTSGLTGLDMSTTDQYAEMRVIRNSKWTSDKDMFLQYGAGAGSNLRLYSNNVETMVLSGGNVGIGRSPGHKLDVNGNMFVENNIFFGTTYNGGGANFPCNKLNIWGTGREYGFGISSYTLDYFSSGHHKFYSGSGGSNWGSLKLAINGGTYSEFYGTGATGSANYIYHGNGVASFSNTNTFFNDLVVKFNGSTWTTSWIGASSSAKIKKDIQDLDDNECLNKLLA
jgi:hypothetical protein